MEGCPRDLNCRHCSYRFWRRGGLSGCWRNLRRLRKETQLTGNYLLQQLVNSVELGMFTVMLVRSPVCCKMQRLYQGLNQCTASLGFPGLPWGLSGKESTCQSRSHEFDPWDGKILWRRKCLPTPAFLPGKSLRQSAWWVTIHGVAKSRTCLATKHHHTASFIGKVLLQKREKRQLN